MTRRNPATGRVPSPPAPGNCPGGRSRLPPHLCFRLAPSGTLPRMATAVWKRCLDGIADVVRGLGLEAIGSNVFVQVAPNDALVTFPCVLVTWNGQREEIPQDSFDHNSFVYPLRVQIAERRGLDDLAAAARWLEWRAAVVKALLDRPIPGVPEVWRVLIDPEDAAAPNLPAYEFFASSMLARCHAIEPR